MFNSKTKIELNSEEVKIIILTLTNLRNELIREKTYTDSVDEVIPMVKPKMKVDK